MSSTRDTVLFLIEKYAPEEAPLVDHLEKKSVSDGRTAKGPLGFGVELVVPLLAPVLWKVVEVFYTELLKGLSKTVVDKVLDSFKSNTAQDALEAQQLIQKVKDRLTVE